MLPEPEYPLMKLFLTSSGLSENLRGPFLKLLGRPTEGLKFFYVPTASDPDEDKFYTCKSLDDFSAIGIDPIWYSLGFKTGRQIERDLSDADVVWIGGGNTFHLLDVMRRTGALQAVCGLVRDEGVMLGGTSAGAIVATPSIETAGWGRDPDPNYAGVEDLRALDLVDFHVHVHYEPATDRGMLETAGTDTEIYAIPDGSAIQVIDGEVSKLGPIDIFRPS